MKSKKSFNIPLDKFIDLSLYDKKFGYYMKKNPFGKEGDFITAPNISRLFSEMIAIWILSFWQSLGSPKKFNFFGDPKLCQKLKIQIAIISENNLEILGAVKKSPFFPKGFFFM